MKSPVHISKMSGKLEGFRSISVNTISNTFCQKMNKTDTICGKCYSMAMLGTYRKTTATALQRNSDLLGSQVLTNDEVPRILDIYFRFDSHGELINATHLRNYVKITEHNPHTTFALWTKRRDLVHQYFKRYPKPDNLILILSNPKIDDVKTTPPRFFDKVFNNVTSHPDENCTGQKCKDCLTCYSKDSGVDVIIERVK